MATRAELKTYKSPTLMTPDKKKDTRHHTGVSNATIYTQRK